VVVPERSRPFLGEHQRWRSGWRNVDDHNGQSRKTSDLIHVPAGTGTITAQVLGGLTRERPRSLCQRPRQRPFRSSSMVSGQSTGQALDSSGQPTAGTVVLTGTGHISRTASTLRQPRMDVLAAASASWSLYCEIERKYRRFHVVRNGHRQRRSQSKHEFHRSGATKRNDFWSGAAPDGTTPAVGRKRKRYSLTLEVRSRCKPRTTEHSLRPVCARRVPGPHQ